MLFSKSIRIYNQLYNNEEYHFTFHNHNSGKWIVIQYIQTKICSPCRTNILSHYSPRGIGIV